MGCCCDQDDDVEILRHLNPSPPVHSPPLQPPPADHSTAILSPMNSHFFALSCRDILRLIFEHLSIPDLARSSCVCRLWHSVASDQEIVAGAFKAPWKVKDVVGKPSSWSFWRDNCLGKFAISHRILRGDSLASLAVKYSVQVTDIKRLNNMMSDHGIYSRERLLIPIGNPNILINSICYIEMDAIAKREVAVLYLDGIPMTQHLYGKVTSEQGMSSVQKILGEVVLMKSNVLDFDDFNASLLDTLYEFVGKRVSLQLVSAIHGDPSNELRGKLGEEAYLEEWITTITPLTTGEATFKVTFDWDEEHMGIPGAFFITNHHHTQFYLKSLTLQHVPPHGTTLFFPCNSWIYPSHRYNKDRIFFVNQSYLPSETPEPLRKFREDELQSLRGDGNGELQEWDRVYDYALYNDLADPDKAPQYARPVLGGSTTYPYPRRGRTGRPPTKSDPETESRIPLVKSLNVYVPRDERFGHLKLSDFLAYALKAVSQVIKPGLEEYFEGIPGEFDSLQDVLDLYEGGFPVPEGLFEVIRENIAAPFLKEIFRTDGERLFKFPLPQVIKEDKSAWRTDEEFGREMLAGLNPVIIRRLQDFPPRSKLDPKVYGDQKSKITEEQIIHNLDGLTVEEAIKKNRLFILDHHDSLMPYLRRVNTTSTKTYASRTILFLQENGTLKPLAIELSLPNLQGDEFGVVSRVFFPAEQGVGSTIWQLAKAYVAVNDSGYHQLISHWLNTHAVIEPFVIATNRQLSVLHPVFKLLHPHFRDTMNINAFARQILINAGGILEATVFPSKYAMEMSSVLYKDWAFHEQAPPTDLIKRGMAIEDSNSPHGLRLVIEDYPYAVDGLEIWSAIKTWVTDYCSFYYKTDEAVRNDPELQSWWKELREEGHGDKKDEPWWPKMQNIEDLIDTCAIIIWIASALHAAVNFGQYPYAGYLPNRPTISRKFMPEEGTPEYKELETNPEKVFLRTITAQLQTLLGIASIEILSRHSSDEVYLGQRDSPKWTADKEVLDAFEKFGKKLAEIEDGITKRNEDLTLRNRVGPVFMPYTLLYPSSEEGLTGKGIPNSVSI
uniref:Lipoxygenase n=1 Tax=Cucumis melo TaxID=3656 RepID=A0A9I9CIT9_CUCME